MRLKLQQLIQPNFLTDVEPLECLTCHSTVRASVKFHLSINYQFMTVQRLHNMSISLAFYYTTKTRGHFFRGRLFCSNYKLGAFFPGTFIPGTFFP
jgi:hypothetical protein